MTMPRGTRHSGREWRLMSNWQAVADAAWQSAHSNQWLTALIVSKRGIRVDGVSDDTMTQLRGAWRMYEFVRQYQPARARELRRQYGYSRWYELYLMWKRYEFSADDCIDHLTSDLSNIAMAMQCVSVHDSRPEWYLKGQKMVRMADVIYTSYDAPQEFRDAVIVVKTFLEGWKL